VMLSQVGWRGVASHGQQRAGGVEVRMR
jgi:hypothetical protein